MLALSDVTNSWSDAGGGASALPETGSEVVTFSPAEPGPGGRRTDRQTGQRRYQFEEHGVLLSVCWKTLHPRSKFSKVARESASENVTLATLPFQAHKPLCLSSSPLQSLLPLIKM